MDKVTQSNAANAEESAAAAEELNAQAGTMRQSVAALLELVDGQSRTTASETGPSISRASHKPATFSAAKQPIHKSNGNGHPAKQPQLAARKTEIPMDDDFKNF
jgi:methyl-accepting chemotaxis protein